MTTAKAQTVRAPLVAAALGSGFVLALSCGARSGLPNPAADAGAPACGRFTVATVPAPLEVFISIDTSRSMEEPTAGGAPKLDAVRFALADFMSDPQSTGIGVTIGFFPIIDPDVPALCSAANECGIPGACKPTSRCFPSLDPCTTPVDCALGETCEVLGVCGVNPNELCHPDFAPCSGGEVCGPGGHCENLTVCDPMAYQPAEPPVELPEGAAPVLEQLAAQVPRGGTPTSPALEGAIAAARARQVAVPSTKAIVLLATDGFPTLCDPAIPSPSEESAAGIPKLVAIADQGRLDGVQTFVVGVFGPEQTALAKSNLDAIAIAGGSAEAYVVTTNQAVSDEFLATLNQIRSSAAACDYLLPKPGGAPLDIGRSSMEILAESGTYPLEARASLAACDPKSGGYVFDKDPAGADVPTRIQLCPVSCALVESDPTSKLEVVVECLLERD